jgi:hypothetical protein
MTLTVLALSVPLAAAAVYFLRRKKPLPVLAPVAPVAPAPVEVIEDALKVPWYVASDKQTRTIIFGCIQAQVRASVDGNFRPAPLTGGVEWEIGVILPTAIHGLPQKQGYLCVMTGRNDLDDSTPTWDDLTDDQKAASIQKRMIESEAHAKSMCPKIAALLRRGAAPWLVGTP